MAKPNTSAPVWKYFVLEKDESGKPLNVRRPRCRISHEEVGGKDDNTSNLHSHIKVDIRSTSVINQSVTS